MNLLNPGISVDIAIIPSRASLMTRKSTGEIISAWYPCRTHLRNWLANNLNQCGIKPLISPQLMIDHAVYDVLKEKNNQEYS